MASGWAVRANPGLYHFTPIMVSQILRSRSPKPCWINSGHICWEKMVNLMVVAVSRLKCGMTRILINGSIWRLKRALCLEPPTLAHYLTTLRSKSGNLIRKQMFRRWKFCKLEEELNCENINYLKRKEKIVFYSWMVIKCELLFKKWKWWWWWFWKSYLCVNE